MRTTVDIEDKLLRAAKKRAAAQDRTLSELVQQALRMFLEAAERTQREPFQLIEAGRAGGRFPSPADVAALLDEEDGARLR